MSIDDHLKKFSAQREQLEAIAETHASVISIFYHVLLKNNVSEKAAIEFTIEWFNIITKLGN